MNFRIALPRGYYRQQTGRREPNRRRLKKLMKRLGILERDKQLVCMELRERLACMGLGEEVINEIINDKNSHLTLTKPFVLVHALAWRTAQ